MCMCVYVCPHSTACMHAVEPGRGVCVCVCHRVDNATVVSGMLSVEGEAVPFKHPINTAQAKGAVERWLLEVTDTHTSEHMHTMTQHHT